MFRPDALPVEGWLEDLDELLKLAVVRGGWRTGFQGFAVFDKCVDGFDPPAIASDYVERHEWTQLGDRHRISGRLAWAARQIKQALNDVGPHLKVASVTELARTVSRIVAQPANDAAVDSPSRDCGSDSEGADEPNRIWCENRKWTVVFEGERASVEEKKRMWIKALAVLLLNPGEPQHANDLAKLVGSPHKEHSRDSNDTSADQQAIDEYKKGLADLNQQIEEAAGRHDACSQARLEEKKSRLVQELSRNQSNRGRPRSEADPYSRQRLNARSGLEDCREYFRDDPPGLFAHLEESLKYGTRITYDPDLPVRWSGDVV